MKFLIDQNISKRIIESISDISPEAMHIKDLEFSDSSDFDLWAYALKNNFILTSTDKEVFNRSIISNPSPKIIYVEGDVITTNKMEWAIRINQETIEQFLEEKSTTCLILKV